MFYRLLRWRRKWQCGKDVCCCFAIKRDGDLMRNREINWNCSEMWPTRHDTSGDAEEEFYVSVTTLQLSLFYWLLPLRTIPKSLKNFKLLYWRHRIPLFNLESPLFHIYKLHRGHTECRWDHWFRKHIIFRNIFTRCWVYYLSFTNTSRDNVKYLLDIASLNLYT